MALATLTEVKESLGISNTDSDDQINALLEPISVLIERTAGRSFTSATVTERYSGGDPTIALLRFPVASITTVTDKVTGTVLGSDEYELEGQLGLLRKLPFGSQWATGRAFQTVHLREIAPVQRWEIVYVGGPVTAPEDVKLALFYSMDASLNGAMGGMQSEKDGDYAYTRAPGSAGLPANAMAILKSYSAGVFI